MEMQRDTMIFYRSFYEAITELPPDVKVQIYDAIFSYGLDFKEVELSGIAKTVWKLIKPQLDANNKRFKDGVKGAKFGKNGGRPKSEKTPKAEKENPSGVYENNPSGVTTKNPTLTPNNNNNKNNNNNIEVVEEEINDIDKSFSSISIRNQFIDFMTKDNLSKDALAMSNRTAKQNIEKACISFQTHLVSQGAKPTDIKQDYLSHFKSWLLKRGSAAWTELDAEHEKHVRESLKNQTNGNQTAV